MRTIVTSCKGGFRLQPLRRFEPGEVSDVRGRDLVHLQCHIGLDTLSWAGRGARVSGLDFLGPAIEAARGLAAVIPVRAVQRAPAGGSSIAAFRRCHHPREHSRIAT